MAVTQMVVAGAKGQRVLDVDLLYSGHVQARGAYRREPGARVRRADTPGNPDVADLLCPDRGADRRVERIAATHDVRLALAPWRERVDANTANDEEANRHLSALSALSRVSRIEQVVEYVAEQVEPQHSQDNSQSGEGAYPPGRTHIVLRI